MEAERVHKELHRLKLAVTVRALSFMREHIALTAHGHGPISNGVADTGQEAS